MLFDQVTFYSSDENHDGIQITPSSSNSPASTYSSHLDNHADFQQKSKAQKIYTSKQQNTLKRKKIKDMDLEIDIEEDLETRTFKQEIDLNETPSSLSTSQSSFNSSNSPLQHQLPCLYQYQNESGAYNSKLSSINTIFNTNQDTDILQITRQSNCTSHEQFHPDFEYYQTYQASHSLYNQTTETPNTYLDYNQMLCTSDLPEYSHNQYEYPRQYEQTNPNNYYISPPILPHQAVNEKVYNSENPVYNHYPLTQNDSYNCMSYTEMPCSVYHNTENEASYYHNFAPYHSNQLTPRGDDSDYNDMDDDSGLEESVNELDMFSMAHMCKYKTKRRSKNSFLEEDLNSDDMSAAAKRKRKRILNHLQRQEATQREKRRMLKLNKAFEDLRKVLPISEFAKNKLSRAETLKSAIEYIEQMSELLSIS